MYLINYKAMFICLYDTVINLSEQKTTKSFNSIYNKLE